MEGASSNSVWYCIAGFVLQYLRGCDRHLCGLLVLEAPAGSKCLQGVHAGVRIHAVLGLAGGASRLFLFDRRWHIITVYAFHITLCLHVASALFA